MKKYLLIILILLSITFRTPRSFAQTPTSTSSATPEQEQKQIERIKDIVASRVAELKLVERRGVLGTVETSTSTQITVLDNSRKKRIIDIDEITEFNDPGNENFGISDIKKGMSVGVIGLLNKGTDHILARFVNFVGTIPVRVEGAIKEIDRRNFVVTIMDENGKEQKVDIDTSTKINVFDEEDSFIKSGFSKIQAGQRVFVSGFVDSKDKTLVNASRFIHFISLKPSKNMTRNLEQKPTPTVDINR